MFAITLAAALAGGSYWAGYESGVASAPRSAASPTPAAIVLGAPEPPSEPASELAGVAIQTERARTQTSATTTSAPSAPAKESRVLLSADGLYVTSLPGPACPGVPKLPWLLVSNGRFAWQGELDGYRVRVEGRLAAGDRVSGTAAVRGRTCKRTVTYRGTAVRAAR